MSLLNDVDILSAVDLNDDGQAEDKPKNTFLNAEEDDVLRKVRGIRLQIVEKLTNAGGQFVVPEKGTDKILLDQSLNALVDEQFKRAKGRKDVEAADSMADWADIFAKRLLSARSAPRPIARPEQRRLPDSVRATDLVPGEMDEGLKPLNITDLVSN